MFGWTRWNTLEDVLNLQGEFERLYERTRADVPGRALAAPVNPTFEVHKTSDAWRIEIPIPGIDPKNVVIEVAGSTLSIRAEGSAESAGSPVRYEQMLTLPQFLDTTKIAASHRFGILVLTLPFKEAVKPRRIEIEGIPGEHKKLTAVA